MAAFLLIVCFSFVHDVVVVFVRSLQASCCLLASMNLSLVGRAHTLLLSSDDISWLLICLFCTRECSRDSAVIDYYPNKTVTN